jgi:hypothetical protein
MKREKTESYKGDNNIFTACMRANGKNETKQSKKYINLLSQKYGILLEPISKSHNYCSSIHQKQRHGP